jgi:hypothetical protein
LISLIVVTHGTTVWESIDVLEYAATVELEKARSSVDRGNERSSSAARSSRLAVVKQELHVILRD